MSTASAGAVNRSTLSGLLKTLGPGIMFAGAAIGVSHLVQSSRAGAEYGFALLWAVLLANLFKLPFFEFVYRYSHATGEDMLAGYQRVGRWALWLVFAIVLISGYLSVAVVTLVTAGLAASLFKIKLTIFWWTAIVSLVCFMMIVIGRYPAVDKAIKLVMAVLAISTITAVVAAAIHGPAGTPELAVEFPWDKAGIAFLLALMGWMPAPIDVGIWPSIWAREREKETGHRPSLKERLTDFYIGYVGSTVLAVAFLALGALVMFATGEKFPAPAIAFSNKLVSLYTETLGGWAYYIVAAAAFTCMFSTSLTCLDGFPRTTHFAFCRLTGRDPESHRQDRLFWGITTSFVIATLVIVGLLMKTMIHLVTIATITAFITAPLMAYLNYRVVMLPNVGEDSRPPRWMHILAWAGLVFLLGFVAVYMWSLLAG
ncbi:Nramp family divalent metal transporter [bacterium]|nr:Nramp family divalent metal transporter [bacterium]